MRSPAGGGTVPEGSSTRVTDPTKSFLPDDAAFLGIRSAAWVDEMSFPLEAHVAPGGTTAVWGVSETHGPRELRTAWSYDWTTSRVAQLFESAASPRQLAPSPIHGRMAFVADVDGAARLCIGDMSTGRYEVVQASEGDVMGEVSWSPCGRRLAFAAATGRPHLNRAPFLVHRTTWRHEGSGLIDENIQDIHVLDLDENRTTRLTYDRAVNRSPRWSPSGDQLVFVSSFDPTSEWAGDPQLRLVSLVDRDVRTLATGWRSIVAAEWHPSGRSIGFVGRGPGPKLPFGKLDLWLLQDDGGWGDPVNLTERWATGVGSRIEFDSPTQQAYATPRIRFDRTGEHVYASSQQAGSVAVIRVATTAGTIEELTPWLPHSVELLSDLCSEGALISVATSIGEPPTLLIRPPGQPIHVCPVTPVLPPRITGAEVIRFSVPVAGGDDIDGWALRPPGQIGPAPTVLCIHGGPSQAYGNAFMIDHHLLVAEGYTVVYSNFRGSGGYGDDFQALMAGEWGPVGEVDHLATVKRAVDLGISDADRLGVYGLSHGGFAACWLASRTDIFKAAVSENGLTDWATLRAGMDADWWLFGELPSLEASSLRALSPLTYASDCRTPMLLVVGEADLRCPPLQSEQFFQALKRNGCEAQMLRLPESGHLGSWTGPLAARRAQDRALLWWFDKYLK